MRHEGKVRNAKALARKEGLVTRELSDEVLVYDLDRDQAHCLNQTAAFDWQRGDGKSSTEQIARRLGQQFDCAVDEKIVWQTLDQLGSNRLLERQPAPPPSLMGMNRRAMVRALGLAAVVLWLIIFSGVKARAAGPICSVPGDYATIQGAVNDIGCTTINVAAGTYTENVTILRALTLNGAQAGVDARGRVASESIVTPSDSTMPTVTIAFNGTLTIDGFSFSGGPTGASGVIFTSVGPNNNMQIVNNRFSNYPAAAVWMNRGGTDITIDKNVMDGSNIAGSGQAIFSNGPQNYGGLFITNNQIINNTGRYGYFVDGNHNVGESATRAPSISGNEFNNNLQGMNLGSRSFGTLAAPVLGSFGGLINNNRFSNHAANGVQGGIQHVQLSGNAFRSNSVSGLALTSFGNTAADRGAQNSTITCNVFTGNGSEGVFLSSGQAAGTISTNVVNQNNISGNTVGLTYNGTETINAESNWWGSATGPTIASNPGGTGDKIVNAAGGVDYTPFLTSLSVCSPTAADGNIGGTITDANGAPVAGATIDLSGSQTRETITDANGHYHFDNVETNGFYTVVPLRANYMFSPSNRSFSLLGVHTDASFTASANGNALNVIDSTGYFVRQHYLDFLNREPDEDGFNFWSRNILSCGSDAACIEQKRIDTSAAYFLSIEFQQTGYEVYRMYKAAYGNLPGAPVPVGFNDFMTDTRAIGQNVIVNRSGWEQAIESNKQAFASEFVQRSRFVSAYPTTLSPHDFVAKLFANAGVTPSSSERAAAIEEFGSAATSSDAIARGRALRRVAENATLIQQEFNRAFVLMQYFGYLRRDPNSGPESSFDGYNFWLSKLDTFSGNFRQAEMVKAFLVAGEYRQRFPR